MRKSAFVLVRRNSTLREDTNQRIEDNRRNDLAEAGNQNNASQSRRGVPDLGVVRVRSKRAPDAQDRLRRLFALLVRYATAEGTTPPETHSPEEKDGET